MGSLGGVILYDSDCGLCSRAAAFVSRHDGAGRFRFAALSSDAGRRLLAEHGMAGEESDSLVLLAEGKAYQGSSAALRVLAGLPWPWKAAAALLAVPPFLREPAYRWVARNRYRLPGGRDCPLPDPRFEQRSLG